MISKSLSRWIEMGCRHARIIVEAFRIYEAHGAFIVLFLLLFPATKKEEENMTQNERES